MAHLSRMIARGAHRRGGTMIAPSLLMTLVEASRFRESSRRPPLSRRASEDFRHGTGRLALDLQDFKLRVA